MRILKLGQDQYQQFLTSRLSVGATANVMDTIPRNKLKLPVDIKDVCATSSPRIKLTPDLLAKLQAACDARPAEARTILSAEFNVPEGLTDKDGKPYHYTKSDLLNTVTDSTSVFQGNEVLAALHTPL